MRKQNEISELPNLDVEHFENIFNVYQNANGTYYYNLLQTVVFPQNLPANLFEDYVINYGDTWPFISYKNYKSTNLWWLILLANNIQNPTLPLKPGTLIKIPIMSVVREVLMQIES